MTPTLHYTYGLPASGKTTFAREMVRKDPTVVRANLDDLRVLLFGPDYKFSKSKERTAVMAQTAMIREGLLADRDVVVDDTNLNPKAQERLAALAHECQASIQRKDFSDVPLGECIKRDAARGQAGNRSVGEDVIRGMWDRYLKPPRLPENGMPPCIVIDVDGTLTIMNEGRGPFEWDKVGSDHPNPMVVDYARRAPHRIVVLSGRDSICRGHTNNWLIKHGIPFVELLMRPEGDNRHDHIIKNELLDDLLTRWYPVLAIDDRQQVVDNVWRARGIDCWQVAAGRF